MSAKEQSKDEEEMLILTSTRYYQSACTRAHMDAHKQTHSAVAQGPVFFLHLLVIRIHNNGREVRESMRGIESALLLLQLTLPAI